MIEKVSMDDIKKDLTILKDYEKIRESSDKIKSSEVKKIYTRYCDAMHSAGLLMYLKFYLLFICSLSKSYIASYFHWPENYITLSEKEIYNHVYVELNKKQVD